MALKLSPRDTVIAIVVGAAAVLVLFLFFGFRPKLAELSELRAAQKVEQEKLDKNKIKLKRLDAIRCEAAEVEAQRVELARRMPQDAELPSFIIELQKIANDADLDLKTIKIGNPGELQGYKKIPVELEAEASFYTVIDFLYRLEKMKREVVANQLSLQPGGYPMLKVSIKAQTFIISDKPIEKSADQTGGAGMTTPAAGSAAPPQ